jgi:hypothetical protein
MGYKVHPNTVWLLCAACKKSTAPPSLVAALLSQVGPNWTMITSCEGYGGARACVQTTGPAGENIVRITEPTEDRKNKAFLVYITRTDGTGVFLTADDGNDFGNRPGTRREPVFSHDELVAMGSDARWTLYP